MPADIAATMAITQRPVALAALEQPASAAAWRAVPAYSPVTTEDKNIPVESQRFMSGRAAEHTVEVRASHAVSVSDPSAVAELILPAAQR
ncbi:hypothetical protein C5E45_32265 [Nocardia nova]|uniref:Alpha/beta hydrolase n=1 Tax=Nocardia nova TaxID=37330 RepID=A0A2S6AEH3_9NOCA|nr:hypothetical protein [Nocardia nova]PPJ19374.1 hypothetical protein C5E41_31705 [Nocardia nova]PPJ32754.1 hypothetical protein C5E45_32265 [Nocardia nova]